MFLSYLKSPLCTVCTAFRYLVNPDQSLQIHYVTFQDAGRYTCTVVNDVGTATASAQLFVEGTKSTIKFKRIKKKIFSLCLFSEIQACMLRGSF